MIRLDSVTKRYGARTAVSNLSFTVEPGEILGFLGPNGAGKTTTIRMIAGAITPSEGTVTVAGYDMANENVEAARHIGYLPERPPLYDVLDVLTYLGFVARAKGIPRGRRRAEIERVIGACQLEEMARREIFKLSKGYRQRVGLAQALLGEPDVLLLDEPTIGLDPAQIHETREVIRGAGRGHAVLLSTHILPEVTMICARVAIINRGQLLAIDTPAGLERAVARSGIVRVRAIAERAPLTAALRAVDGVDAVSLQPFETIPGVLEADCLIGDRDGIEARVARAVAGSFDLLHLARQRPTLENVFLHYVRESSPESAA